MATPKFGSLDALHSETPQWAKWVFRVFILLTTVATFVIAGDDAIPNELKVRIGLYLKAADMLVLGLSKMFGVDDGTGAANQSGKGNLPASILLIFLLSLIITGCNPIFGGGGWIVPLFPLAGFIIFGLQWRKYKDQATGMAAIVCAIVLIGILIWMKTQS